MPACRLIFATWRQSQSSFTKNWFRFELDWSYKEVFKKNEAFTKHTSIAGNSQSFQFRTFSNFQAALFRVTIFEAFEPVWLQTAGTQTPRFICLRLCTWFRSSLHICLRFICVLFAIVRKKSATFLQLENVNVINCKLKNLLWKSYNHLDTQVARGFLEAWITPITMEAVNKCMCQRVPQILQLDDL